jgi:putative nucleotidyltransferase with HDIG domain
MTLTEWLSYDHPLLRELAVKAPGTFQHSVNVGLLADAAARAVGANPLLSRIGGLYHDVGKLRAPGYFIENQSGDNPHDSLDPLTSARILRAHVTEGIHLVREHHMGRVVANFVREHHGKSLMRLFYQKALDRGEAAQEADFRYEGPAAGSRESGIVMIADQLEATARARPPADLPECEQMAADTIDRIVASGELARARLSARELDGIRVALSRTVFAMYHRRLTYPASAPAAAAKPALVSRLFRGQRGRA